IQYVQEMGLAGIMFWAADLDDFTGSSCNEGKYPLMNKAVNLIRSQIQSTISSTKSSLQEKKRIVCYYTNSWSQYRPDQAKFYPEDLDGSLCTHIVYAFIVLKNSKLAPFQSNDEDTQSSKGLFYFIFISLIRSDRRLSLFSSDF
ncbi:unnamed protein product, partial [Rotaria sp. Silwood2]